jgi:hypothetical protein
MGCLLGLTDIARHVIGCRLGLTDVARHFTGNRVSLTDIASHVIGCRSTQATGGQIAVDNVTGNGPDR